MSKKDAIKTYARAVQDELERDGSFASMSYVVARDFVEKHLEAARAQIGDVGGAERRERTIVALVDIIKPLARRAS